MTRRYVKASELKSFAFCERAWFLERSHIASASVTDQARGAEDHRRHAVASHEAIAAQRVSHVLLLVGICGLVVAALWWWYQ
jgi:hypothetical protein